MVTVSIEAILKPTPYLFICEASLLARKDHQLERTLDSKKLFEVFQYLFHAMPRIIEFAFDSQDDSPLTILFLDCYIESQIFALG